MDLRIVEMLEASHDLHLMYAGGHGSDIQKVYATAADHASCEGFLGSEQPALVIVDVRTPRAACELAAQEPSAAAVANEAFGVQFGLDVARRDILDRRGDRVRYAVVGARPSGRTGADVTSLVFTARDGAGALLDVLKVLAEREINLMNIQSHPLRGETWSWRGTSPTERSLRHSRR